jgi:hypothetical protein
VYKKICIFYLIDETSFDRIYILILYTYIYTSIMDKFIILVVLNVATKKKNKHGYIKYKYKIYLLSHDKTY